MFWAAVLLFSTLGYAGQEVRQLEQALCPFREAKAKALFAGKILQSVSIDEIKILFQENEYFFGKCKKVHKAEKNTYLIEYEYFSIPITVQWKKNVVSDFSLESAYVPKDSFEKMRSYLQKLSEKIAYVVMKNGEVLENSIFQESLNYDRSAWIKVLLKLKEQKVPRDRVIQLQNEWLSDSYGDLKDWDEGSYVTIETLMRLMLWNSDGSAHDHLLLQLKDQSLEEQDSPYPTWRSYLGLGGIKIDKSLSLKEIYQKGDQNPKKLFEAFVDPGIQERVGWFSSPKEICSILFQLKNEKLLINSPPSRVAREAMGQQVRIALHSREKGIAHNAYLLEKGKNLVCISLVWNRRTAIPESIFEAFWHRLLDL